MIKKFTAPTVKEAIQLAKENFGNNAIILQTKKSEQESGEPDMFELTAMSENNSLSVPGKPAERKSAKLFYTPADLKPPQKNSPAKSETELVAELNQLKETIKDMSHYIRYSKMLILPDTLRFLVEEKGVDEDLASELVHKVSQKLDKSEANDQLKIKQKLQAEISTYFNTHDSTVLPPNKPKLICLVGPTGVGKTTSIIKLATNPDYFGQQKVGLITIDTYRVAAAAQLKTFAALARLPLEIVYEPAEFKQAVDKFKNQQVILVDTAGRSPLNSGHFEDLKRFLNLETFDEIHLVLSASMRPDILVDSAKCFSTLPVNRLIISKIDETTRLGNILNVGKKIDLPISFFTNGQRVPDDIFLADKNQIANMIIN